MLASENIWRGAGAPIDAALTEAVAFLVVVAAFGAAISILLVALQQFIEPFLVALPLPLAVAFAKAVGILAHRFAELFKLLGINLAEL